MSAAAEAKKLPACKTCRQRKVKCDRQQPACQKCKDAGWKCPGYQTTLKFRDQSDKFSKPLYKPALSNRDAADVSQFSSSYNPPISVTSTWSPKPAATKDLGNGLSQWQAIAPAPTAMPMVRTDFLRYAFAEVLETRRLNADLTFISVYPSASLMTDRIGSSPTLDAAIICACKKSHFAPSGNESMWRKPYVRALRALQSALRHPTQATSTETLGASLLLMTLDHYTVEEDSEAWKRHAQGLVRLVEHRGPAAFKTELDLSILQAASGHIVFGAVEAGIDCFLDSPEWHAFFEQFSPAASSLNTRSAYAAELHLLSLYTPWPGLLNLYTAAIVSPTPTDRSDMLSEESRSATLQHLLRRLLAQRAAVVSWTRTWPTASGPAHAFADERVPLRLGFEASMAQFLVFLDCMAARVLEDLPDGLVLDSSLTPTTFYNDAPLSPWTGNLKSLLVEEAVAAKDDAREKTLLLKARNRHSFQGVRNAMTMSLDRLLPFDRPARAAQALRDMAAAWGYFDNDASKNSLSMSSVTCTPAKAPNGEDWLEGLFESDPVFAQLVAGRPGEAVTQMVEESTDGSAAFKFAVDLQDDMMYKGQV